MKAKEMLKKNNSFIEHSSVELERKKKKEREEKYEVERKKHPEVYKRIDELKESKKNANILKFIGIGLIIFGVIFGQIGKGFFIISLEFIIGIVLTIIGCLKSNKYNEKIKDLKLEKHLK